MSLRVLRVTDLLGSLRDPHRLVGRWLGVPIDRRRSLFYAVLPLLLFRPTALFIVGLASGAWQVAVVMAAASLAMSLLGLAALSRMLEPLAKVMGRTLTTGDGFLLAAAAQTPIWLAGLLTLLPAEPLGLFVLRTLGSAISLGLAGRPIKAWAQATPTSDAAQTPSTVAALAVAGTALLFGVLWPTAGLIAAVVGTRLAT